MHMAMGHGDMGHGGMDHGDMDMGGQCSMNVRIYFYISDPS
jgi:copper transporter 1